MRDYDERLYDGDVPTDELVTGRCDKCGEVFEAWESGWSGEDATAHLAPYDYGGGELEWEECGPVYRVNSPNKK